MSAIEVNTTRLPLLPQELRLPAITILDDRRATSRAPPPPADYGHIGLLIIK